MTKKFALQRLLDYLRMEYDNYGINHAGPIGIAYQDYRASEKEELAATVRPEAGPANNARDAITILEGIMAVVHCDNPSQSGLSQARDFCNTLYKYIKSLPAPVA